MKMRTLLLLLLWWPLNLAAQSEEALLTELSRTPEGIGQLELLARISRSCAQRGAWEDVVEFAGIGAEKAREQDIPEQCVEFELAMAEATASTGDPGRSIAHALRAFGYANEVAAPIRARCAVFLARAYLREGMAGKAQDYAQQALSSGGLPPSDKRGIKLLRIRAELALQDVDRAYENITELIGEARRTKDEAVLVECLGMMSNLLVGRNDPHGAIDVELERLGLVKGTDKGIVLNNLGELSARLGDAGQAHKYFGEAATWLAVEPDLYARCLMNSAIAYARDERFPMAEEVIRNAIAVIGGRGSGDDLAQAMLVRAGIELLAGRFSEAMATANQGFDEARKRGNRTDELAALELLSRIAFERGAVFEKQKYDDQANVIRQELDSDRSDRERSRIEQENNLHRQERDISAMTGSEQRERLRARQALLSAENQAKEFGLLVAEKELQDARLREEAFARERAQQELTLLQGAMARERQDRELRQLQAERTVQMLRLNKLDLERVQKEQGMAMLKRQNELLAKDAALRSEEQKHARIRNFFALAAIAVLAGVAGFFFWVIRKVKGKNITIREQVARIGEINAQLTDKNADLMSSINYAENIQRSIIPTEAQLRTLIPDSFLYYRPRDVVSGDLPYIHRAGSRSFIATIDCTGHGVPAAMLSFMAYYNLNDIIGSYPDLGVADILGMLHQRIREAVHARSDHHPISDGMDITLVEIDLAKRTLWYSGAQNALLVVRDGECERIRGDKCSIGDPSGECMDGFKVHRLELQEGDRVYLFSDGLIHQFGGEGGRKKFSSAKLMRTVSAEASCSARHMGVRLAQAHKEWQGDTPQTDDIVLIGFSIDEQGSAAAAA